MKKLDIELDEQKTVFGPGDVVSGTIQWSLDENPRQLELSLFWYTSGKGTRDVGVIDAMQIDNPGALGSKAFSFTLPRGPCSFSGRLISLIWALELTCTPGGDTARQEITVSSTGREILLGSVARQEGRAGRFNLSSEPRSLPDASA